jgi:hypothetical protein
METRIKILISILITVTAVGYFFFREMKNDYNKDLEDFKNDMDND